MMALDLNTELKREIAGDHEDLSDHLHALVKSLLGDGLCPRCMTDLDDDGFCVMCGATFLRPVVDAG